MHFSLYRLSSQPERIVLVTKKHGFESTLVHTHKTSHKHTHTYNVRKIMFVAPCSYHHRCVTVCVSICKCVCVCDSLRVCVCVYVSVCLSLSDISLFEKQPTMYNSNTMDIFNIKLPKSLQSFLLGKNPTLHHHLGIWISLVKW